MDVHFYNCSITEKLVYALFCVYFISQEKQKQYKVKEGCVQDSVTGVLTIALFIIKNNLKH